MNRFLFAACVLFWATSPNITHAAVFERDWQLPGDGLLTYDDLNRREWLDIPDSLLSQFPGTLLERIDLAIAELEPGGLFEDFTLAKSPDVIALAQSAGIDTGTDDFDVNHDPTEQLISYLSPTLVESNRLWTLGIVKDLVQSDPETCFCHGDTLIAIDSIVDFAGVRILPGLVPSLDPPGVYSMTGLFLYREVPEPSTLALLASAVLFCILSGQMIR